MLTNVVGYYFFPELPIGVNTVRAELPGFNKGIEPSLNPNARVDISLPVGEQSESVTVVGDARLSGMHRWSNRQRTKWAVSLTRHPVYYQLLLKVVPDKNIPVKTEYLTHHIIQAPEPTP